MPAKADGSQPQGQRLDKWLWAARFFKTRSLAAAAIAGGKVQVDGQRVKPAKLVRPGVTIRVRRDEWTWEVTLRALSTRRRPATEASELYAETEESRLQREQRAQVRPSPALARRRGTGRPTKKERRSLARLGAR
jgi:ribosome-associated heat shock protein Hsp15